MDLKEIRKLIDQTDDQIIDLIIQRYNLVKEVKAYKKANNLEVLDQSREQVIYDKLVSKTYADELKEIYTLIMSLSKDLQK